MNIKVKFNTQGYFLSTVYNGIPYTRLYSGYEIEEAKELFENYILEYQATTK